MRPRVQVPLSPPLYNFKKYKSGFHVLSDFRKSDAITLKDLALAKSNRAYKDDGVLRPRLGDFASHNLKIFRSSALEATIYSDVFSKGDIV